MNDEVERNVLERSLRRYRIAGPPPDLRARIVGSEGRPRPALVREWLPALAIAALIVLFSGLAASVRSQLAAQLPMPDESMTFDQPIALPDEVLRP